MVRPLKKILHIDDDAIMRMMVKKSIERSKLDMDIQSCETLTEFIDLLTRFNPDLLLIDVVMPVVDGPALLEKVRRLSIRTPAIFMTGKDNPDIPNREQLDPILGIIHKPFAPNELGQTLIHFWTNCR